MKNNKQNNATLRQRMLLTSCIVTGLLTVSACDNRDRNNAATPNPNAHSNTENNAASVSQPSPTPLPRYWVYIDNGAIQCEQKGLMPDKTAKKLMQAGIKVKASACATITGSMMATQCGLKDLGIHLHEIEQNQLKQARGLGFEPIESISHHGDKGFKLTDC